MVIALEIVFIIVALLLILMVLFSPHQEGGLAGAFGGLGSESFFGTRAHQHVNRFTIVLAVAFVILVLAINRVGTPGATPDGETPGTEEPAAPSSTPAEAAPSTPVETPPKNP